MSKRTYYGFQLGHPTYPAGEWIVITSKPHDMRGVITCRAESVEEARTIIDEQWTKSCLEALEQEKD